VGGGAERRMFEQPGPTASCVITVTTQRQLGYHTKLSAMESINFDRTIF